MSHYCASSSFKVVLLLSFFTSLLSTTNSALAIESVTLNCILTYKNKVHIVNTQGMDTQIGINLNDEINPIGNVPYYWILLFFSAFITTIHSIYFFYFSLTNISRHIALNISLVILAKTVKKYFFKCKNLIIISAKLNL